jgi:DNA-directed RNA polymerase subunit RPC12/RpoP
MGEKKVICLKCKKEFISEIDTRGIPYHRICPNCKKNNKRFGRGVSGTV